MKRRHLKLLAAFAATIVVATSALWIRSYYIGDYVRLTPSLYLSFARGSCRIVPQHWIFVPPFPLVRNRYATYPIDKIGGYPGGQATDVPLWFIAMTFLILCIWLIRRGRTPQLRGVCSVCGYDLRATPERCPECGRVLAKVNA